MTCTLTPLPAAEAQPQPVPDTPRLGVLVPTTRAASAESLEAFRRGLGELGYVEGRTIAIEYRWADDRYDRLPALAADLVRQRVDVLVTYTTPGVQAAKRATTSIPIVMVTSGDAVATGLVASLARPGGNVTGSTFLSSELYAKQLEILRTVMPGVRRIARLVNAGNPSIATVFKEMDSVAATLKLEVSEVGARKPEELPAAFAAASARGAEAIVVSADPMLLANARLIAELALKARLPSIGRRQFAEAGGMIALGTYASDQFRRAPYFVDRILKGAKPAELPVEQPSKLELVLNVRTARALGIAMPRSLVVRADRLIE